MAAKASLLRERPIEEIFYHNDAVSLCLLVNRRARTMRVIDFRAGPSNAKRALVRSLAAREGVDKVYTLVERDEVATWVKLGFQKEGNIPGYYKRSDAFFLGSTVGAGAARRQADEEPLESEMRLIAAPVAEPGAPTAAQELMERTLVAAKRQVKLVGQRPPPAAKVAAIGEADARKAVAAALRSGRALTGFEPFGRDVERRYFSVTARGGFELVASTESQACFGNAHLELLTGPRSEGEALGTFAAVRALCEDLTAQGACSVFALAPSDDVSLATAFLGSGFRRTGLLAAHLVVGARRHDAILWSRKLANPADE